MDALQVVATWQAGDGRAGALSEADIDAAVAQAGEASTFRPARATPT